MANLIKLGNRPKSFKLTVTVPLHNGEEGLIPCEFKYRTRTEFGEWVDGLAAKQGQAGADITNNATLYAAIVAGSAETMLEALDGWGLDVPLTAATAQQLADELAGAPEAIMERYRKAIIEGRLGN